MRRPGSLKVGNAAALVTLDPEHPVLTGAGLMIESGRISYAGPHRPDHRSTFTTIDGRDAWVSPTARPPT